MRMKRMAGATVAALVIGSVAGLMQARAGGVNIAEVDGAGLKRAIAAHKGKVVVVNFWATWCGPCVAEFPDLVKLRDRHKAQGLELLTVSADFKAAVRTKATAFLTKNHATTGAYHNERFETLVQALEPSLPATSDISIPRTYIFNRQGKLVKTLVGGQTAASLEKAVVPLLAKG